MHACMKCVQQATLLYVQVELLPLRLALHHEDALERREDGAARPRPLLVRVARVARLFSARAETHDAPKAGEAARDAREADRVSVDAVLVDPRVSCGLT